MVRYCSTRGGVGDLSFEQAILAGYARDGGLMVPERVPPLPAATLDAWLSSSSSSPPRYTDVVKCVLRLFVDADELGDDVLERVVDDAFADTAWPDNVVEYSALRAANANTNTNTNTNANANANANTDANADADADAADTTLLELYHGPTCAFKDLALGVLVRLCNHFLARRAQRAVVVVGTSGDTGPAALRASAGASHVHTVVLYPIGRCSRAQELQMSTCAAANCTVVAVDGNSDELDVPIAAAFARASLVDRMCASNTLLMSVNSINWGRVLVQSAHYIHAAVRAARASSDRVAPLRIVVPTGAAGNLVGGLLAHRLLVSAGMRAPFELLAVTNENDVVHECISRGHLRYRDSSAVTPASACDISAPYGVERLLWLCSLDDDDDDDAAAAAAAATNATDATAAPPSIAARMADVHRGVELGDLFARRLPHLRSVAVDSPRILHAIAAARRRYNRTLCPHTAMALVAALPDLVVVDGDNASTAPSTSASRRSQVVVATAHAGKFEEVLRNANVEWTDAQRPRQLAALDGAQTSALRFERDERDEWTNKLTALIERCCAHDDADKTT